eukprot:scpid97161/ scgid27720/ 
MSEGLEQATSSTPQCEQQQHQELTDMSTDAEPYIKHVFVPQAQLEGYIEQKASLVRDLLYQLEEASYRCQDGVALKTLADNLKTIAMSMAARLEEDSMNRLCAGNLEGRAIVDGEQ